VFQIGCTKTQTSLYSDVRMGCLAIHQAIISYPYLGVSWFARP
jgi:hypothetical protein